MSFRIMIFCQDNMGLGHTARALRIASYISDCLRDCSILLLTDLPMIGRFRLPRNLDYVHLPNIGQNADGEDNVGSLKIALGDTLKIRRKIAEGSIKTFKPDLILIDRDPTVMPKEMERLLTYAKVKLPQTRVVWALEDVMGEPDKVIESWHRQKVLQTLNRGDEIWVYGAKEIFDLAKEYRIPAFMLRKLFYTNYLKTPEMPRSQIPNDVRPLDQPFVLVTAGSGRGGFPLLDTYLRFLEKAKSPLPFTSVIISGPMMESDEKNQLKARVKKLEGVVFHRFSKHVLQYTKHASFVISSSGYNSACEILSYRKPALFAPDGESDGHLRSQILNELCTVDLLKPAEFNPEVLGKKVCAAMAANGSGVSWATKCRIPMNGLDRIVGRIQLTMQATIRDSVGVQFERIAQGF